MANTFLKTTLRSLYREKMYAVINIAGLSLAIACCLILGLYLYEQLTYDQHNTRYREIYRVVNEINTNGKIDTYAITSQLLGEMLTEEYAEVKGSARIRHIPYKRSFRSEDKTFLWDTTAFANNNFFELFDHDFIYGDPETLKTERFFAVSESFARKYWGDENPIGKSIITEISTLKVTHVFADLPKNTHFYYDVLQSDDMPLYADPTDATGRRYYLWEPRFFTYLLMSEDYDIRDFKDISDSFYERHMADLGEASKRTWRAWLQPLTDIHYNSDVGSDQPTGNKYYLYGFAAVAVFILLVACINYMNLAIARATKRAKEVGMRKILGSGRARLILQFMGEAIFFSLVALVFGYILVQIALTQTPINSELLDNSIVLKDLFDPRILGVMLVFSLVLGLISGIYPSLYLSSILPLSALVGSHQASKGSIRLREMLVLIQFIISVCVIACTLLMALQMRYVSNKSLGFDKENRLIITLRTADVVDKVPTLKKELLKNSSILGVSLCTGVIGTLEDSLTPARIDNNDGVPETITVNTMRVGNDFIEVMGIELVEGRDFSKRLLTDVGTSFVVNETMVKKMGWDQPLGKRIRDNTDGKVIGVVKDFHYGPLRNGLDSFVLRQFSGMPSYPGEYRHMMIQYLVVNVAGEGIFETLDFLEDKMAEFDPKHAFEFEFLDDFLNKLYQDEKRLMSLTGIFAAVCIFISCMGLFGLAAFTTEQRTKEIGIRKVLGSSTWQIITMLARGILLLVLGGAVIAFLIAYYAMDEWLADFAYRININMNLWVFLVSAVVAAAVAFITVALQSFKTAHANPIDALRYE